LLKNMGALSAVEATDLVTRTFLGVQINCAQCHDHKFVDRWKKSDYWGVAAFFTKVQKKRNAGNPGIFEDPDVNKNRQPDLDKVQKYPTKLLGAEVVSLKKNEPYRPTFAKWVIAPQNPFFARAMTNRMWAQFFGRGLVNPIDDMIDIHPASHPE